MTEQRFADTAFFVAILNRLDDHHQLATEQFRGTGGRIITTSLVLVELGNFLGESRGRTLVVPLIHKLEHDLRVQIIPGDSELLATAFKLYDERPDKEWSMTDCASFAVMKNLSITEAFTTDHHFEQAGFTILLK